VQEAVPYEEFKQNPYTVCCTTSLGGHLSYFELGGGRWHARPVRLFSADSMSIVANILKVSNFFKAMAANIDLESLDPKRDGSVQKKQDGPVNFNPMRRKMQICLD